jgi:hypothetical protein
MIDIQVETAEERGLRAELVGAAGAAQLGGPGARAMHPAAPHVVARLGRRARARRRAGAASILTAAALSASVLVADAGGGLFTLPWLRDGSAGPGALYASAGRSHVGDVVNALDPNFFAEESGSTDQRAPFRWFYEAGAVKPLRAGWPSSDHSTRRIDLRTTRGAAKTVFTFTVSDLTDGGSRETATRVLGVLTLRDGDRGEWLRVRPSAEDGWLVLAVLPPTASAVQARVAGADVLLPLGGEVDPEDGIVCTSTNDNGPFDCLGKVTPPTVQFRLVTKDAAPPIDAITYIDKDGVFVDLGEEALAD